MAKHISSNKNPIGEVNYFIRCQKCEWGFSCHYLLGAWNRTEDCEAECPRCNHLNVWIKGTL